MEVAKVKQMINVAAATLAVVLLAGSPAAAQVSTLDFEGLPPSTTYGATAGDSPGDVVLVQDDIMMSVEELTTPFSTYFNEAEVGGAYSTFFNTTPLSLNNIGVRFDFSNVGLDVERVRVDFREFGGFIDFQVNDGTVYQLTTLTDLPEEVAPGVTRFIDHDADFGAAQLTLFGAVDSFQIGGQELAIDTIRAIPEPATMLLLATGSVALLRRRRAR